MQDDIKIIIYVEAVLFLIFSPHRLARGPFGPSAGPRGPRFTLNLVRSGGLLLRTHAK